VTDLSLSDVSLEDFGANSSLDGRAIEVRLSGNADLRAIEALEGLLVRLHVEALRLGVERVTVDLRPLEFMNSSCFKGFVTWINEIQSLPDEQRYRLHFRSNAATLWQRRSLHALRCFAVDLITVEA
jgi:hypothetical protein